MKKSVLVVGMNPSKVSRCGTFKRLENWMEQVGVTYYGFMNVYNEQGSFKKTDIDYVYVSQCINNHTTIVALGNVASEVLTKLDKDHLKMPQPSGLNRLLNNKEYEKQKLSELNEYVSELL